MKRSEVKGKTKISFEPGDKIYYVNSKMEVEELQVNAKHLRMDGIHIYFEDVGNRMED